MKLLCVAAAVLPALVFLLPVIGHAAPPDATGDVSYAVRPIGRVQKTEEKTLIVLDEKYERGLLGLDGFSHIFVFWWFDRNDTPAKRATLQVHPMGNPENPRTGVFATRSPVRPNLIALTLCKIVSIDGRQIQIEATDAFDGTPVLDIKPYIPGYDSPPEATIPEWLERARKSRGK